MIASWGMRRLLVTAMVALAVGSVALATLVGQLAVGDTLERFGKQDLGLTAERVAAAAAAEYRPGIGWPPGAVAQLRRLERVMAQELQIRDRAGAVVPGSAARLAPERADAPIRVGGRIVGTAVLAHQRGGYLRLRDDDSRLESWVGRTVRSHDLLAGAFAALLGLGVAIALAIAISRPIRNLTSAAERLEAGDLDTVRTAPSGAAELQRLGEAIGRVTDTLRRQDEMRRKAAAELVHEVRGPLGGLSARLEALEDGRFADPAGAAASMQGDVARVGRLIEDFQSFAIAQRPTMLLHRERLELSVLARGRAAAFAEDFQRRGIEPFVDVEPATVHGDAERIGQIVDNLLRNAVNYTPPGGRVILRVISGHQESIIQVADTGRGIPPQDLPHIFERFWRSTTTAAVVDGSGLGLAVVDELTRAHGGFVDVDSRQGHGSRFSVHLPTGGADPFVPARIDNVALASGEVACVAALVRSGDWPLVLDRVREGVNAMIVDLTRLASMPPRSLTILAAAQGLLTARGGHLVVICPDESVSARELSAAGVRERFILAATLRQALGLLEELTAREPPATALAGT